MQKEIIITNKSPAAIGPYSQAIKINGFLFVSGQLPLDPQTMIFVSGGIKEQTLQVLKNIDAIIKEAGMQPDNAVKCSCFLKNMSDFIAFNEVYTEYFGHILPARECVEVSRLPKDALVEISVICAA